MPCCLSPDVRNMQGPGVSGPGKTGREENQGLIRVCEIPPGMEVRFRILIRRLTGIPGRTGPWQKTVRHSAERRVWNRRA